MSVTAGTSRNYQSALSDNWTDRRQLHNFDPIEEFDTEALCAGVEKNGMTYHRGRRALASGRSEYVSQNRKKKSSKKKSRQNQSRFSRGHCRNQSGTRTVLPGTRKALSGSSGRGGYASTTQSGRGAAISGTGRRSRLAKVKRLQTARAVYVVTRNGARKEVNRDFGTNYGIDIVGINLSDGTEDVTVETFSRYT